MITSDAAVQPTYMPPASYIETPAAGTTPASKTTLHSQFSAGTYQRTGAFTDYLLRSVETDIRNQDFSRYTLINWTRESEQRNQAHLNLANVDEIVTLAKKVFGLNNAQVSRILGVSRQTLYNHLKGEQPSSMGSYEKLYVISHKAQSQYDTNFKRCLKTVLVDGKTLLGHLTASLDDNDLTPILDKMALKINDLPEALATDSAESKKLGASQASNFA